MGVVTARRIPGETPLGNIGAAMVERYLAASSWLQEVVHLGVFYGRRTLRRYLVGSEERRKCGAGQVWLVPSFRLLLFHLHCIANFEFETSIDTVCQSRGTIVENQINGLVLVESQSKYYPNGWYGVLSIT